MHPLTLCSALMGLAAIAVARPANIVLMMACSISAPVKPAEAFAMALRSNSAGFRLYRVSKTLAIETRSVLVGRSIQNSSSKRPLRIISGGRIVKLFEVPMTKTGVL